ncbi:hypothetical protein [Actinomadura chokoriensis]|uniref:hypothetical protein n=1 Tax=Actinomadura chokoriensis TaxID=454156 RepID=UPI0031F8A99B
MGLEDDVERLKRRNAERAREENRARAAEQDRERLEEERMAAELPPLLEESAAALRKRSVPLLPVHEMKVVHKDLGPRWANTSRYPTRKVLGEGWLFNTSKDDNPWNWLVLMSDGATLARAVMPNSLSRRRRGKLRGYWPSGDFVCMDAPVTRPNPTLGHTVEAIRTAMIDLLAKHDTP